MTAHIADKYVYNSLDNGEFRLIHVEPDELDPALARARLRTHPYKDAPPYWAVSYVWGDSTLRQNILVDERYLNVSQGSSQAFNLAIQSRTPIWVDAVCINQEDPAERAQQVSIMNRIYGNAIGIAIWLGPSSESMTLAFKFLRAWRALPEQQILLDIDRFQSQNPIVFDKTAWAAVDALLRHDWFKRSWTHQEIVLANQAMLICGHDNLPFEEFSNAIVTAEKVAEQWRDMKSHNTTFVFDEPLNTLRMRNHHWQHLRHLATGRATREEIIDCDKIMTLRPLLRYLHELKATDPRDKIYALLGICEKRYNKISPNYNKTVTDVYSDFVVDLIQQDQSLSIISPAGLGIELEEGARPLDLPSWVPDYRECSLWPSPISAALTNAGHSSDSPTIRQNSRVLPVSVVDYSMVEGSLTSSMKLKPNWYSFIRSYQTPHPTGIPQIQAFIRTMITDQSGSGPPKYEFRNNAEKEQFYRWAIGFMCLMGHQEWITQTLDGTKIGGYEHIPEETADYAVMFSRWVHGSLNLPAGLTRDQLLEPFTGQPGTASFMEWPRDLDQLEESLTSCIYAFSNENLNKTFRRAFFWTKEGYIGLGPEGMKEGDRLCVILGLDRPFLLRRTQHKRQGQRNRYYFVGECYVYGLMSGETKKHLAKNQVQVKSVELW